MADAQATHDLLPAPLDTLPGSLGDRVIQDSGAASSVEEMNSRDVASLYRRMNLPVPADLEEPCANKFNATKKSVDGILFDSCGEALCYRWLKLQLQAGAIADLVLQPRYVLQGKFTDQQGKAHRKITYTPDFRFVRDGRKVCVDFKGKRTEPYILRMKTFIRQHPEIVFEEWNKSTLAGL